MSSKLYTFTLYMQLLFYPTSVCNKSNTTGATSRTGPTCPYRAPLRFLVRFVLLNL